MSTTATIEQKPTPTYTLQSAFDLVWNHFCNNQAPAAYDWKKNMGCLRYKFSDTETYKCAFGVLIPDESYRPEFEGIAIDFYELQPPKGKKRWECAVSSMIARLGLLNPNGIRLIGLLQEAHDLAAWNSQGDDKVFSRLIRENLVQVATRLKLIIPSKKVSV